MFESRVSRPLSVAVLMTSTVLSGAVLAGAPALAQVAAPPGFAEVVVTASKREEKLQKLPMSVQAIDTKTLKQLNISNFSDYVKIMPSVQLQQGGPSESVIYMRGVSDGGNGNHSGPQPTVATYLDEQPITTIGGTLDVHVYDLARVEVIPGPQGTLYGSSSESGTLRLITNKPSTAGLSGAIDLQGNTVDHGGQGGSVEGFVNVPLSSKMAVRIVGFAERDAGFIDNVPGTRPFASPSGATTPGAFGSAPQTTIDNSAFVAKHFNHVDTFGGRAALKFDLNDSWTIMPTIIGQDQFTKGTFGYEPSVGDLQVNRFAEDASHDRWIQSALTINGKIGRFDLTYSGGYFWRKVDSVTDYTDYTVAYDQIGYGAYWTDRSGNLLANPQQIIHGQDWFEKESNELRIASPSTDRLRFLVGGYQERQRHLILQDYVIAGFGDAPIGPAGALEPIDIPGWPNTLWLTLENRVDRDQAAFGEVSYDITPKLTITGGLRYYHYDNSLFGFYGFSANFDQYAGFHSGAGANNVNCLAGSVGVGALHGIPCANIDKASRGSGETWKANATYRLTPDALVYFTYSTGYRPGGVNRSPSIFPTYGADSLTNYEVGWKTSWFGRSLIWNGALYDEDFSNFQFAFLGPNSLTIVENAPSARILGFETNVQWRASSHLTVTAGGAYNDAVLTANFCGTDQSTGLIIPNCADADALALHGEQLPYIPKFKGDVTGRYTFPLMGWNAHMQATVAFQTHNAAALYTADRNNLGEIPGFATLDLSAGLERDKTSFELYIKNATDERGQVNRTTPCTISVCSVGYPGVPAALYVYPIQPLTVGLRLGQRF